PATGLADSGEPAPTLSFFAVGVYPVTLVVTDDEGSSATDSTLITVATGVAPTALFSARAVHGDPLRIAFSDLSTGDVSTWSWEFGDGSSSTAQAPEHLYAAIGDYSVRLTVDGPSGSDAVEDVVHVSRGGGSSGGGCTVSSEGGRRGGDPLLAILVAAL